MSIGTRGSQFRGSLGAVVKVLVVGHLFQRHRRRLPRRRWRCRQSRIVRGVGGVVGVVVAFVA
eukprot:2424976-Pyramimonas_sp.AAC.1